MKLKIAISKNYGNSIDGKWFFSDTTISAYSPWDKKLVGKISDMTKEDINQVVKNSKEGQKIWANMPVNERCAILKKLLIF